MSFSFGNTGVGNTGLAPGGFSFGSPVAGAAGDAKVLTGNKPEPAIMGTPTAQPGGGFSFGAAPTVAATPTFGASAVVSAPSFGKTTTSFGLPTLGGNTAATSFAQPTSAPLSSFGNTTTSTGFNLLSGATSNTAVISSNTPSSSSSFGSAVIPPGVTQQQQQQPATVGLNFGVTAAAAAPVAVTTAVAAPLTFNLGGNITSAAASSISTSNVAVSAPAFGLGATGGVTTVAKPDLAATAIPSSTMSYGQLEDLINKWTLDLENQGKIFTNQAKQLNAWDRLLISNGDKILSLNKSIERVKTQQTQLDQELDFVRAQQKELEDLIVPLEKELQEIPVTDMDRNHTYQLAENMDSQLKQMSEDLKEIIEQLNESNKTQELSNPISQIGRILNAHMNSLQWIDVNTSKISSQLDQISKMHDMNRRTHEINLQRTYD